MEWLNPIDPEPPLPGSSSMSYPEYLDKLSRDPNVDWDTFKRNYDNYYSR
jgi:hypothetical protein